MSDEKDPKTNLRILEFDKKKERTEANETVRDMFLDLAKRADEGDIEDFVITFRSVSRGTESMIGGTVKGFDFIGYIGMLEVLKTRMMTIMSRSTYAYAYEKPKKEEEKPDGEPEKT
jgi:hypothetical protein